MLNDYLKCISLADVYDVAIKTPLDLLPSLSKKNHNTILLKREDLQPVFSFKLRGAFNKIRQLSTVEKKAGIIASSAGNHAQGVALAAQKLGIHATIVMPVTTPSIKVKAVRELGASVVLHGDAYDDAYTYAMRLADEKKYTFIHPYDDVDVIAGQATVAVEIVAQCDPLPDAVFVPVGGGGLIAGVAVYLKAVHPEIKVIGVEPDNSACLYHALKENKRVILKEVGLFADGVAVKQIGKEPFRIAKECVDEVILVSTDEICAATKDIFDNTRAIAEPAGALALAGLKKYIEKTGTRDQRLVAINSGANLNFDRLKHIAERAEIGEHTEALLAVTIPEKPGSFLAFCQALGKRGITEFNYRFSDAENAVVFVGVRLVQGESERHTLVDMLTKNDYAVLDLTDNEVAKLHIRHMVGGPNKLLKHERLYRFEFPERPGALLQFLSGLGEKWNITLFHYRNHGSAYGRVLMGVDVPKSESALFKSFLKKIGYTFVDESHNPAYPLFL
ncbi:MAG: threonine ammonia-lyase, biosynthetic [Candidatus Margulisbacteria bacterium]|nr:threonine ammonia-lyase, biosynthetic [Candidatus Margulisiibacteriota bacterium]